MAKYKGFVKGIVTPKGILKGRMFIKGKSYPVYQKLDMKKLR